MLPFCGYNMGDYFSQWLKMGERAGAKLPAIYFVNWFRKDARGKFIWPGYGENSRVLKWFFERLEGKAAVKSTPIGNLPTADSLDLGGLDLSAENLTTLLSVDTEVWSEEAALIPPFYEKFGDRLPQALWDEYDALLGRLQADAGDAKRLAAG